MLATHRHIRRIRSLAAARPFWVTLLPIAIALIGFVADSLAPTVAQANPPIMVTTAADAGPGSLRAAIGIANATAGADVIDFNIPPGGPQVISITSSALPAITETVTIDGSSQPGFAGTPIIRIDGATLGAIDGLSLIAGAANSVVLELDITDFGSAGVAVSGASGVTVLGNYLGTNMAGTGALGNGTGVAVVGGATHTTIGGAAAAARNVISGNGVGILVMNNASTNIVGNYIGTDATGASPLGNGGDGIHLIAAQDTQIGDNAASVGNVISGNGGNGIELNDTHVLPAGPGPNHIEANHIGTNAMGSAAVANARDGILIKPSGVGGHADDNVIGVVNPTATPNIISGNGMSGIEINGTGGTATNNVVLRNWIGMALGLPPPIPNGTAGVSIITASGNVIGAAPAAIGDQNFIAGNNGPGIILDASATNNTIEFNRIGGGPGMGNVGDGVLITGNSSSNTVGALGGPTMGANEIRSNGTNGVEVASGAQNGILSNIIGQNASNGIVIASGANNEPPEQAPVVMSALANAANTIVVGYLNSQPSTNFLIQIFESPSCGPGNGQGDDLLGTSLAPTNAVGFGTFNATLPLTPVGTAITVTATDPVNNTSAFSNCFAVSASSDVDNDGCPDAGEPLLVPPTDPSNPWDFYSVPVPALYAALNPLIDFRDHGVGATDAQAVFAYFKKNAHIGTLEYEQDLNLNGIKDGIEYDRSNAGAGMSGPPDGAIGAAEAQIAFAQFKRGYVC